MSRRPKKRNKKRHGAGSPEAPASSAPLEGAAGSSGPNALARDAPQSPPMTWPILVVCMALSGFAALLYQTAWMRQFSIAFGTSELAVVIVLAAYMGGLALGASIAGRVVGRLRRPLLAYGVLEAGIALTALSVPWLLDAAASAYVWLLGGQAAPPDAAALGQGLFYLLVGFLVLALPTGFMGATLPLLIRHAVTDDRRVGPDVALLYGVNTAGAVAGAVAAGFLLLPALGLSATVWVGVAINALVFAIAVPFAMRSALIERLEHTEDRTTLPGFVTSCIKPLLLRSKQGDAQGPAARMQMVFREQPAWVLPLILIAGANAFFYEVLWTRLLAHVLGASVYAFATMLATFLAGIALGGGLAGRLALDRERSVYLFAMAQVATGVLSMAVYAWMGPLLPAGRTLAGLVPYAAAVMFPATVFIGATFPLAVRILTPEGLLASPATAKVYAWNTAGAIAGAILAGFYLIPALGFEGSIRLAVLVNFALAVASVALISTARLGLSTAAVAPLLLAAILYHPTRPVAVINSSGFEIDAASSTRELYFGVGRSSTVLLTESAGMFELRTNGLPEASVPVRGAPPAHNSQTWLTALPVAARPEAQTMLVIGFGGGAALEGVPESVQSVDVIELESDVIDANRQLAGQRASDPLADARVDIVINDARNALRLTDKRYDIIVSQPSHPWTAGASHLFTREFVDIGKRHLAEQGVFVQWMHARFIDADLLKTLAATLLDAFENVRLYQSSGTELLLLASDGPLQLERELVSTGRPLRRHLLHYSAMGFNSIDDFVAALTLDEDGLRSFAAGAPPSTDDRNHLATRSRSLGDGLSEPDLVRLFEPYDPLLNSSSWVHRDLGRRLSFTYIATRLLVQGRVVRARRLAEVVPDATLRALVASVGFAYDGYADRALEAARAALQADPGHVTAQFAVIQHQLAEFAVGNPSAEAASIAAALRGPAAAVIEGWRLAAAQNWPGLADLDAVLARSEVTDIWYPYSVQLRAEWRTKIVGDDRYALDALRMLDRALMIQPLQNLYILRAAAAARLDDRAVLIETGRHIATLMAGELERAGENPLSADALNTMLQRLRAFEQLLAALDETPNPRARQVAQHVAELMTEVRAMGGQEAAAR